MPYRVFSLAEVAEYLHVAKADVEKLVKRREIPFEKKGDRLIFRRKDIDAWASQRIMGMSGKPLEEFHRKTSAQAREISQDRAIFPDLVKPAFVAPALRSKTKASVLRDMVDLAARTQLVHRPDELLKTILEREQMCSTALSGGMALLHPHVHQPYLFEDSFVVLGRTIQSIPFGAPDGMATDLFFMICCKDDRLHLHVLARICTICHHTSALLDLREAKSGEDMLDTLIAAEQEVIKSL